MKDEKTTGDYLNDIIFAPMKYTGAVGMGVTIMFSESPLIQMIRSKLRPDMDNPDLGNFVERFKVGYNAVTSAFEYRPPKQLEFDFMKN